MDGPSASGSPQERSDRPEDVDPLADVFTAMRVRSASHCRVEATAPWGVTFAGSDFAKFGLVTKGTCWLDADGQESIPLRAGDSYVVAAGVGIAMRDARGTRLEDGDALVRAKAGATFRIGGDGAPTGLVTGLFALDAWSAGPFFALLPPVLVVRTEEAKASALGATLDLLAMETEQRGLGATLVISRLAEILFVQTIRGYHASHGSTVLGWLCAMNHPQLGASLRAMHRAPAERWSVDSLAAVAGMSRSAFAERFKERVGDAPLEHLARLRMYRAGALLRDTERSIAEIADAVGYESTGAFARAFERVHGRTPGAFRRDVRSPLPRARAVTSVHPSGKA